MSPTQTVKMTREELLTIERLMAQKLLDGTLLSPTDCCLACGERAQVREGTLEMFSVGSLVRHPTLLSEIVVCLNGACGQVAVHLDKNLRGHQWWYGDREVVCIEGAPFMIREIPVPISRKQRENYTRFLAETA